MNPFKKKKLTNKQKHERTKRRRPSKDRKGNV